MCSLYHGGCCCSSAAPTATSAAPAHLVYVQAASGTVRLSHRLPCSKVSWFASVTMTTSAYPDMRAQSLCMPADRCLVLDMSPSLAAHEACSLCHSSYSPDQTLHVVHKSSREADINGSPCVDERGGAHAMYGMQRTRQKSALVRKGVSRLRQNRHCQAIINCAAISA